MILGYVWIQVFERSESERERLWWRVEWITSTTICLRSCWSATLESGNPTFFRGLQGMSSVWNQNPLSALNSPLEHFRWLFLNGFSFDLFVTNSMIDLLICWATFAFMSSKWYFTLCVIVQLVDLKSGMGWFEIWTDKLMCFYWAIFFFWKSKENHLNIFRSSFLASWLRVF